MKILIDENLPKKLKSDLSEYQIYTVRDMGWQSKSNGELIQLMLSEGFNLLLTFDQNLQYQQNLKKYPISVLVINSINNQYDSIKPYIERMKLIIQNIEKQDIYILL